ncbi:MAG: hypothetical protein UZ08_BCD001001552 [Candidatus Parvibacillus calidus]|nr:MAG: hypothetical protein UZ08_BCD001001552 [Candidatus Parvibacillus calidus]
MFLYTQSFYGRLIILTMLVLTSLSFQTVSPDRISVRNLGISNKEEVEIFLNFSKDDIVSFNFKSSDEQNVSDKSMTYSLSKIPISLDNSVVREKQVSEASKPVKILSDGQYLLTVRTSQKGVQFFNLNLDKMNKPWNSNAPLIKIHASIMDRPGRNQKKLRLSYSVQEKSSINIIGAGKSADIFTLEENSFRINTTLDKGISISEKSKPEILIYLDEENLKKKNLWQIVESLFKKGRYPNLKNLAEISFGVVQNSTAESSKDDLVFSKPSSNQTGTDQKGQGGQSRGSQSGTGNSFAGTNNSGMPLSRIPQDTANLFDTPEKITIGSNFQRIDSSMYLSPVFDYSADQKRKCKSISKMIGVGEDDMLGFWVGISTRQLLEYNRQREVYKGKMIGYWSPLMQYADVLYIRKMMPMAMNIETRHLPLYAFTTMLDNIEIAIVDEQNKELFEKQGDYKSYIDSPYNGLYKTSGQMFGFIKLPDESTELYLCSCNRNKYNGVRLYTIFETFSKNELQ